MHVHWLDPIGAVVAGLAIDDADPDDVEALRLLLADRGVIVLPHQVLDDAGFVAFLARFGPLTFTVGEQPVPDQPDLNVISNVGRSTPPKSTFHADTTYVARPPAYTALRAVQVPEHGGTTQFTDQYRAFDTLPFALRNRLEGRTIRHVVTGVDLDEDTEQAAEHPIFRPHPVSGRTALHLTAPSRCAAISGMDQAEARAVVEDLFAHSTADANTYRHEWSAGDVVMWDNAVVMHRADHAGVVGDRVMHRGMVATH